MCAHGPPRSLAPALPPARASFRGARLRPPAGGLGASGMVGLEEMLQVVVCSGAQPMSPSWIRLSISMPLRMVDASIGFTFQSSICSFVSPSSAGPSMEWTRKVCVVVLCVLHVEPLSDVVRRPDGDRICLLHRDWVV